MYLVLCQGQDRAVDVMITDTDIGAGGTGFDSRADQIGHSAANSSAPYARAITPKRVAGPISAA